MPSGPEQTDPDRAPRGRARRVLAEHDRRRLRATWTVLGGGVVAGLLASAAVAAVGLPGRVGLAVLLLVSSFGCMLAMLTTAVQALLDEYRGRGVARRRGVVLVGLLVMTVVLLAMSAGAAGG